MKVNKWLEKWSDNITDEWKEFVRPDNCNASKMYVMVKTHKADNPLSVITSGCYAVVEKLSILVEETLYPLADRLNSKIKDTNNMLVPMLTLPWPSMTLLPINSTLSLVFGKHLEMMPLYYGNMVPLLSLLFKTF